eukprot:TRINITY_DN4191_c0_g2_i3.p1 TRINITY_DN4191_c0_g2~~TRINITY_DN4191_c0_g2_i3.p1  ORF type:complete len:176 (+),score=51.05 TRINITY_DN4191_c0_g2_i3:61-528(+)
MCIRDSLYTNQMLLNNSYQNLFGGGQRPPSYPSYNSNGFGYGLNGLSSGGNVGGLNPLMMFNNPGVGSINELLASHLGGLGMNKAPGGQQMPGAGGVSLSQIASALNEAQLRQASQIQASARSPRIPENEQQRPDASGARNQQFLTPKDKGDGQP